jgi:hypothetical protein
MNYPSRLLPQPNYKHIDFNQKHQNCFLLRHTETQNIKDEFGKLRADCLAAQTDHLKDYSTNLFPNFILEDAKIRILKSENFGYFTQLWNDDILNNMPQHPIDFEIAENRGLFFLRIGEINYIVLNNFDDSLPSKPVCRVIHTPININFWHCSLRWFCNDKDSSEMTKSERRRVLSAAKTFLIEHAYFDLQEYDTVQNTDFEK